MWLGREQPLLLGDVLLEDVVLQRSLQLGPVDALILGRHQQESEQHLSRPVDGHRDRDLVERDPVHELAHVVGRINRHPAVAHLPERPIGVAIEAHQGRHVERHRHSVLALGQEVSETSIRVVDRGEAGELPNRPQSPAIAGRVDAAGIRIGARVADIGRRLTVGRQAEGGNRLAGQGLIR